MNDNKRKLDVYYYIDLKQDQDISLLERSLNINLLINTKQEYEINSFINCNFIKDDTNSEKNNSEKNNIEKNDGDVIKRGLIKFNSMVESLKLKNKNDVWLFYISNGNINTIYENVFVILLNKEPMFKKSHYVISKNIIDINTNLSKRQKLENLKIFNKNIEELLKSDKIITYTNLT